MERKTRAERALRNFWVYLLAVLLCLGFCLTGCGGGGAAGSGGGAKQADPLEGKYIPVVGEMMGVALTGDELAGFGIELQGGGKAVMTVDGESHNVKWTKDDATVTLTVDGEEITGERGEDYFVVRDMLGLGMDLTFAKEGTPAADPVRYLPETEKFMLQDWQSVLVTDILGDPTDEMLPDALQMSFRSDHTMDAVVEGKEFKDLAWSNLSDYGSVDSEDIKLTWKVLDDGLEADYVKDGEYYTFFCPKDPAASRGKTEAKNEPGTDTETGTAGETEADTKAAEAAETDGASGSEAAGTGEASGSEAAAVTGRSAAQAGLGEHGKAPSSPYSGYWDRDWYGWYKFESCDGDYEHLEDSCYDVCGSIFVEGGDTGRIVLWDEEGSAERGICDVEVHFGPGLTDAGCMMSESGSFLSEEENVGHADWIVDPGASDVNEYDHMIEIDGEYEDEYGSLRYYIYLRPWGMDWEDVRKADVDFLPVSYDYWYTEVMNGPMPDRIGREESGFGRDEPERFENYTVLETPKYYPAGTLTLKECYLLPNSSLDNGADGYILDEDTVLEKPEELDGWEAGDNPLSWMGRLCGEGSTYSPAGVYDITVSGDHIDIIHGLYWWD